jgi:hypothetical protein
MTELAITAADAESLEARPITRAEAERLEAVFLANLVHLCVPANSNRRATKGRVYFIGAENGLVKIGWAVSPGLRLASLQTGSPLRLRLLASKPGSRTDESDLHRRFAHLRVHGEWFKPDDELHAYLAEFTTKGTL